MPENAIITDSGTTMFEMIQFVHGGDNSESMENAMRTHCLESTSLTVQKRGMEYLYINGYIDELELLINKNVQSDNPSNRLWGLLYQIMLNQEMKRSLPCDTLEEIKYFKKRYSTKEPELLFLIELMKENAYLQLAQYDQIGTLMATHEQYFSVIEDRMLVSYFKIRLYLVNVIYHLMRNELIMSRKYAYRILNLTENPSIQTKIHNCLGASYTFDAYEKGIYHLRKSLEIAKKYQFWNQIDVLENKNIPFLSAHFNKIDDIVTEDKGEQAHIELAKGNNHRAIEILRDQPDKTPFQLYYLGKAKQDKGILMESYSQFIEKRSDYFFSRLPMNALKEF